MQKEIEGYGKVYPDGYSGRLPDGNWQLFPTEQEYLDYLKEELEDDKKLA